MNKKILFIIIILAIIRVFIVLFYNSNYCLKENKTIDGTITNIKRIKDKEEIDVNRKYKLILYKKTNFNLGDKIRVKGKFTCPSDNTVPNLFNYRKYLLSKGIKMISNNAKVTLIKKNTNVFYTIKNLIIKKISLYKSHEYLSTFILGDTSNLDKDVKQGYSDIGIVHLFAISGMHISFFLLILNRIFKKSKYKNIVIIFFLLFFLFLTNFCESLLRCVMFFGLSNLNKKFKFGFKNEILVIITALLLIIINPFLIYSIGFSFSIIITFFIILSSNLFKLKSYLLKTLIMSIICFLSSVPILAFHFFKINFLSIIYNVIFVPLITFLYFPLSLITFVLPIFDTLYYQLINILEYIVLHLNNFKLLTFIISKPNLIIILIYYIFLFLSVKVNKKYITFFFIILLININSSFFINKPEVIFLDVGQGDSNILILPRGKALLIDTGGIYKNENSIVKNKTIPYLNSRGINQIQSLIITHGDFDHMGEGINLFNDFKVKEVIFNCGEFNELEQDLIYVLANKKIPYYSCIKQLNIDGNKLYFLNHEIYDNENDNSNVIYMELNNYKFLFMADASIKVEKDLLKKYNLNNIDVLKVGHHGSKTSSGKAFIDNINLKYSIISVGKNNRYNLPNKQTIDNLSSSKIYRTDKNGSITVKIKNNKLKINTCSP